MRTEGADTTNDIAALTERKTIVTLRATLHRRVCLRAIGDYYEEKVHK